MLRQLKGIECFPQGEHRQKAENIYVCTARGLGTTGQRQI